MDNNQENKSEVSLPPSPEDKVEDSFWWTNWKKNVVNDPSAPELYSQQAIWGFSFLLAPIFGSVLMAMNFKRIEKSKFIIPVIIFGILWYALALLLMPEKPRTSMVYLLNMLGGLVLIYFLWPKFIGKELKYRKRSIIAPAIIGATIAAIVVFVMIVSK